MHTEVYRARAGRQLGHPRPSAVRAPRWAATEAPLELLTHDAVLFTDGLGIYDEGPAWSPRPSQGSAVAAARSGRPAGRLLRNHGVVIAGEDVRWAVLTAVTLERAVRFQSIAAALGAVRPIPADVGPAVLRPRSTRTGSWTSTGQPGCAGCDRARRRRRRADVRIVRCSTGRPRASRRSPRSCCSTCCATGCDLTGAKRSCDVQVCGTCTVLVDGAAGRARAPTSPGRHATATC